MAPRMGVSFKREHGKNGGHKVLPMWTCRPYAEVLPTASKIGVDWGVWCFKVPREYC